MREKKPKQKFGWKITTVFFLPLINAFVRTSEKWFHAVDLSETNNTDIEVKAAYTRLQKLNTKFNLHQSLWCEIESIQSKTSISNGINMQLHLLAIQNATQSRWRIKKSIGKTIWFRFAIDYATNENSFFFLSLENVNKHWKWEMKVFVAS